MGLILAFLAAPSPTLAHGTDDRLAAGFDRYTLDPNHLTALAAVAAERYAHPASLISRTCDRSAPRSRSSAARIFR